MAAAPELPTLECPAAGDWERWLEQHHLQSPGVWLKFAKKGSPRATVTYAAALQSALCFGWIDGQVRRLDEHFYRQRFTPRGRRSVWSKINTEHIARLEEEGRLRPAGRAAVEAARADGRWAAAYDPPSRAEPPAELLAALRAEPAAQARWDGLNRGERYSIIWRLQTAKRPETKARRITEFVALLAAGGKVP